MTAIYLVAVALHVLAAVAWVGGSMFLVGVLGPTLRSSRLGPHAVMVIRDSGRRFRTITYAMFAVFVLTAKCSATSSTPHSPSRAEPPRRLGASRMVGRS